MVKICFASLQNTNRAMFLFQRDNTSAPSINTRWNDFVSDMPSQKVWLLPNKYFTTKIYIKIKEASFKLIHKYCPVKRFLKKFKSDVSCSFRSAHRETVPHLFWHCVHTKRLGQGILRSFNDTLMSEFSLMYKHVLFGFFNGNRKNKVYIVGLIIILAKLHIHKCKFSNKRLLFSIFHKECELYLQSIQHCTST